MKLCGTGAANLINVINILCENYAAKFAKYAGDYTTVLLTDSLLSSDQNTNSIRAKSSRALAEQIRLYHLVFEIMTISQFMGGA